MNNDKKRNKMSNADNIIQVISLCVAVALGRIIFPTHSIAMSAVIGAFSGVVGVLIGYGIRALINKVKK